MFEKRRKTALLVLDDGSVYRGLAFAGSGEMLGEVVFNTGMTGYQEIVTDPSYKGQIVVMTYPLIGNTGINPEDMESAGIHLEGFVIREYQDTPSNWRSREDLKTFLESRGKLGVEGIDTRALTRRIRTTGAMRGILSTETDDVETLLARVRDYPGLVGRDLVREVSCQTPYIWKAELNVHKAELNVHKNGYPQTITATGDVPLSREKEPFYVPDEKSAGGSVTNSGSVSRKRVVVLDCGVKYNILRNLEKRGCEVLVFPAATGQDEILSLRPDGVLLSNGPGDPAALPYIVETVKNLLGKVPIFGICLGHQILGQAAGGRTAKLKFGHHGINQPVRNVQTGKVEITSQNHGFVVLPESLSEGGTKRSLTFINRQENLNDRTSEGLFYPEFSAFSVQYHPEAAPGPHDASYLFDEFISLMERT
ncbi:MAG: carbamoyl phosphate synthase small subunit [Syntrophus sp. RIFOXYC2_FULL_54_9]|nr:MAG: carbamoyl phosphate synthase small subunit [Syntrophus sp. RIFOXYC2_FULL_54_9]